MKKTIVFIILPFLGLASCQKTNVAGKSNKGLDIQYTSWQAKPVITKSDYYSDNKIVYSQTDTLGYSDILSFGGPGPKNVYINYKDLFKTSTSSSTDTTEGGCKIAFADTVLINSVKASPIVFSANNSNSSHEAFLRIQDNKLYYYEQNVQASAPGTKIVKLSTTIYTKKQ